MRLVSKGSAVLVSLLLVSASAMSGGLDEWAGLIQCGKGARPAILSLAGSVGNSGQTCPLLEDKELRKLVDKYGETTLFAWSLDIFGTCFSGTVDGSLTYIDGTGVPIQVSGTAESAQRLFPVPPPEDYGLVAVSSDQTLQVGAAMTALRLQVGVDKVNVLVDDHFLATPDTDNTIGPKDTEDFRIAGSSGPLQISGRLAGRGTLQLGPNDGAPFVAGIEFEDISGFVCVR